MKPKVSVCIPTYNGAKYLKECLESILSQTFTNFEVLIVDDCSADETVSIAQEYATDDQRVQVVVNKQNLGLAGNWNRCVELAQGEWIKFVFQDDLIEPTCLEKLIAASQPKIPILFCRRQFIFEPGTSELIRRYHLNTLSSLEKLFAGVTEMSARDYSQVIVEQIVANKTYYNHANFIGEPVAVLLHRNIFPQFGNFNPYLIQSCDLEFWTRVAIHTGIIYVPETLATFRVHGESTTAVNEGSRQYRKSVLDPLITMHDFAFNPMYAPLRDAACHQSSVNLVNLLADKAYDARRMAERAATNPVDPDPSLLAEWDKILELYPILSDFSKRSFLKQIMVYSLYRWRQLKRQGKALRKLMKR